MGAILDKNKTNKGFYAKPQEVRIKKDNSVFDKFKPKVLDKEEINDLRIQAYSFVM